MAKLTTLQQRADSMALMYVHHKCFATNDFVQTKNATLQRIQSLRATRAAKDGPQTPGMYLVSGSRDKSIRLWDSNGICVHTFVSPSNSDIVLTLLDGPWQLDPIPLIPFRGQIPLLRLGWQDPQDLGPFIRPVHKNHRSTQSLCLLPCLPTFSFPYCNGLGRSANQDMANVLNMIHAT